MCSLHFIDKQDQIYYNLTMNKQYLSKPAAFFVSLVKGTFKIPLGEVV